MDNGSSRHVIYEQINGVRTWRAQANKDNDYLIDRAAQKAGRTYSGIAGFAMQDSGVQELMGPIVDRTKENLVSCDNGIIMARHRLMRAAKALVEKGETPPGRRSRTPARARGRDRATRRRGLQGRGQGTR